MKKKLRMSIITIFFAMPTLITSEVPTENTESNFDEWEQARLRSERRSQGLPGDPTKKPTDPDVIENYQRLFFSRNFYRKRIFYGTDKITGEPSYQTIRQHELNNPEFGNVRLVIFRKKAWYKLRFSDRFDIVGTYSNFMARHKLIGSMNSLFGKGPGAVWCPEQNVIIGGTRDKNICQQFAEFMQQSPEQSKSAHKRK